MKTEKILKIHISPFLLLMNRSTCELTENSWNGGKSMENKQMCLNRIAAVNCLPSFF